MRKLALITLALLACLWALFPFYWALVSSLKTGTELFSADLLPPHPSFQNFRSVFVDQPFGRNLWNSVVVALTSVLVSGGLALLAAFPLSRRRFPGRRAVLLFFLGVTMFPQIAILSGLFQLIRALGLFNQPGALILSYLLLTLPFTVWTLSVFMREIPRSLEEAAFMDGAGTFSILFRIFLPILAPAMVTTSLLGFIAAWNEFLFALTFTLTDRSRTVPVAIAMMSGATEHEIPWGKIMAASIAVTLPIVALVLVFQRRIVSGLTAGSVKG